MISGRTEQILHLRQSVGHALRGEKVPNTVIMTGEAGIGKTTLLDTLVEKLQSSPDPPIIARALCSTPLAGRDIGEVEALAPWLHIVGQLANEQNERLARGRSLVGKLALAWVRCIPVVGDVIESAADTAIILKGGDRQRTPKPSQGSLRDQEQMFRQCINLLAAISESTPLVVIIDDMHWSDTSSTNLLFSAARELAGRPVCFVIAYRPDEAAVSRGGDGHPLVQVIGELERYSAVDQVRVTPFNAEGLVDLLRAFYPDYTQQPEFESWLLRISSGNPLFITQYLATLQEDGRIEKRTGLVSTGYQDVEVPESAQAVVLERIRRLEPAARDLLRYASVEGETFSTLLLARISEEGRLAMLRTLRRIEEDHHVISSLGKQRLHGGTETTLYRFTHTLVQRTLYTSLGEEERELVHEEVLAVLNEEAARLRDAGEMVRELGPRIAAHAEVLGRYREAALAVMEGAEASWTELAVEETLRLVEQAITNIARARESEQFNNELFALESKALRSMGRILRYRGDYPEALRVVEESLEAARRTGDDKSVVGGLIDRANTLRHLGRLAEAEEEVRNALELAITADYRAGHAGALNSIGTIIYPQGRKEEAVEVYLQAIDIQKELEDSRGLAQTYSNLGNAFNALGDVTEAARCYTKSLDIAAESDNLISYGVALLHLGNLSQSAGDHAEALDFYEQSREIAERISYRELRAHSLLKIGALARTTGDLKRARMMFEEVADVAEGWVSDRFFADLAVERGLFEACCYEREGSDPAHFTAAVGYLKEAEEYFRRTGNEARAAEIASERTKLTPSV